jgi:hypothetical protein
MPNFLMLFTCENYQVGTEITALLKMPHVNGVILASLT